MSTRILANDDADSEGETGAILFDGTTGQAYGVRFDNYEQAEAFVAWATRMGGEDPARMILADVDRWIADFRGRWEHCGLTAEEAVKYADLQTSSLNGWKDARRRIRELEDKIDKARVKTFGVEGYR